MNNNTYNHRREGTPATGIDELYIFAQERYTSLLREAEAYRAGHNTGPRAWTNSQATPPFAHLLNWAKMQLTALTHAA